MSGKNYGPNVSGYDNPVGRNWETVVFQAGKAVLDRELNLGQDIDVGSAEAVLGRSMPSGWFSSGFLDNDPSTLPVFVSSPGANTIVFENNLAAQVNGWLLDIANTGTISTNTLALPAPPTGAGAVRTDLLILEVWRILISPAPSTVGKSPSGLIWGNGNVKNDLTQDATLNYPDDILDATLGVPSTLRVQIQFRLRVIANVNLFSFPYGLDDPTVVANTVPTNAVLPDGTPSVEGFNYTNQSANGDSGLWVAGDGNPANSLGTVDGYMYAIPFFGVFRRNSTAFNPLTNMNGAGQVASSPPSDRPDGLFSDLIVQRDFADLRMGISPTGWDYQEVLDKNVTYLLDNGLRSEWMLTGVGTQGHSPFYSNQIGGAQLSGGGPLVAQFDAVCRSFSGRAIYETIVVALPKSLSSSGSWTSGATVKIDPTRLPIYPYQGSPINWAVNAPPAAQIVDILSINWVGNNTGGSHQNQNAFLNGRIATVTGLGTAPVSSIHIVLGTVSMLDNELLYVELLMAYPPGPLGVGNGLTNTPTEDFTGTQQTFQIYNPSTLPNASPYYVNQSQFTADTYGKTYFNSSLASLDWAHREAVLVYVTVPLPSITMMASNDVTNQNFFMMPERIPTATPPTVLRNGSPLVGGIILDPSGRFVTFTNSADYTSPGDYLTVTYTAIRPFPVNGEQVVVYYNTRAPQTSRGQIIGTSLTVVPRCIPKTLYTLTSGVSSPDYAYPFPYAYVQTGGVKSFTGPSAGEYELTAESNISISDFNADVGMLALPTLIPYTPDPNSVTFSNPSADTENRTFFLDAGGGYLPNAYAQDLSDPKNHKNFLPFLAELGQDGPAGLGFKGQLVLVMLTRWGGNDATNGVFFGSESTTSASVFRLRNNLLNRKA